MEALLIFGIFVISLAVTYAWWVKVRLVCLRQDIFDIRDQLFDDTLCLGATDDPAYKQTRDRLNTLARTADLVSIATIIRAAKSTEKQVTSALRSDNPQLQSAIDKATSNCTERLLKYLIRETLSGWILDTMAHASRIGLIADETAKQLILGWVKSSCSEKLATTRRKCRETSPRNGMMHRVGMNTTHAPG